MELHLDNQEAALAFRIIRNRSRELEREIIQNSDVKDINYLRHKAKLLKNILAEFSDVDEKAHMKGFQFQEIEI